MKPLSLTRTGDGAGTVTADAGIDCGTSCTATYTDGTTVTLTATPAAGSTFTGWSGCDTTSGTSCTVTMTEARSVSAGFALIPPTITLQPANRIALAGRTVSFSVSSGDAGVTYRWQRSPTGLTWTDIPGATGRTLSFVVASTDTAARFRAVVTAPTGATRTSNAATLTVAVLNKASVTSGRAGATVALVGRGLSAATKVTFGGVAAPRIVVASSTTIWVSVPAGAKTGALVVSIAGGTLRLPKFTVLTGRTPPTITGFSPTSAKAGVLVTITGTHLIGTTSVRIGTLAVSFRVLSPTKVTFLVPTKAVTGRITLITAGGTVTTTRSLVRLL